LVSGSTLRLIRRRLIIAGLVSLLGTSLILALGMKLSKHASADASLADKPVSNVTNHRSDNRTSTESASVASPLASTTDFIFPVLGAHVTDPLQNTNDPREDGWSDSGNPFGNPCGSPCSGDSSYPYHPGADLNKSGGDANVTVYAVQAGEVIRSHQVVRKKDGVSLGWFVIIRHQLDEEINISKALE
jgi:hypothetical protein